MGQGMLVRRGEHHTFGKRLIQLAARGRKRPRSGSVAGKVTGKTGRKTDQRVFQRGFSQNLALSLQHTQIAAEGPGQDLHLQCGLLCLDKLREERVIVRNICVSRK